MSLKTDYKDEILPSGQTERTYNIVDQNGTIVQSNVRLQKAYTPQQEGDNYGALDINKCNDAINQVSNPNLLINADFRNPVNQRGASSYTGAGIYTIDRWRLTSGGTVQVVSGGLKLTSLNTVNTMFTQPFERRLSGTYTLTIIVKEISGVISFFAYDTSLGYLKETNLKVGLNTITFTGSSINVVGIRALKVTANVTMEYMKLEQGSNATMQVPKLISQELFDCQRYYEIIEHTDCGGGNYRVSNASGSAQSGSDNGSWQFKVVKRVIPTMNIIGTTTYENCSSLGIASISTRGCRIQCITSVTGRYRAYGGIFVADAEIY